MKITIDTKEDSPEEIKKVVAMLSHLIENQSSQPRNIFEDTSPSLPSTEPQQEAQPANLFNMFGDTSSSSTETSESTESEPDEREETENINVKTY